MAKHPKRRRRSFKNYFKARIDIVIDVGTLAAQTGIRGLTADAVDEKSICSSVKATYTISDQTPAADVGPIDVYVIHPDYTLVEVEEFIENTASWSRNDMVAQEIANRRIRLVGTFPTAKSGAAVEALVINDGKPITTKLNWTLRSGQGLGFVVYNNGTAAFATTDPDVRVSGHANMWEV